MMLHLRIRKAEVAMADGRLDDAYQQAIREDVRDHRRGQRLISRLTKAYERRGQVHLHAGNVQAAVEDAERAARLGGNQPSIVALRDEATLELAAQRDQRHARHQKLAAARRCLATGDYALGAKLCEGLDQTENTVVGLMQDADLNRRTIETSLERCRKALKSGQWEQALDALDEARRLQPLHADVADLAGQLTLSVAKQIRTSFSQGRLDLADLLLCRLRRTAPESFEVQDLSRILDQCRDAVGSTRSADLTTAIERLKSVQRVAPEAKWLHAAIKDAEQVARSIENLRTGPLGALSAQSPAMQPTLAASRPRKVSAMPSRDPGGKVPQTFLLHLDGAGSFLVVRGRQATVGSQSRSRPVDVPLAGQVGLPQLRIERVEDDYFLHCDEPVPVNGKQTTNTLLTSQDQIRLGRRGGMQFSLPCAASTSATLNFSGLRLAHGNTRRVVLMDDSLILGPQPSAHIQSPALDRAMVIHWRDGQLRIRPMSRSVEAASATIALDCPYDLDGLSLVVTNVKDVA